MKPQSILLTGLMMAAAGGTMVNASTQVFELNTIKSKRGNQRKIRKAIRQNPHVLRSKKYSRYKKYHHDSISTAQGICHRCNRDCHRLENYRNHFSPKTLNQ